MTSFYVSEKKTKQFFFCLGCPKASHQLYFFEGEKPLGYVRGSFFGLRSNVPEKCQSKKTNKQKICVQKKRVFRLNWWKNVCEHCPISSWRLLAGGMINEVRKEYWRKRYFLLE